MVVLFFSSGVRKAENRMRRIIRELGEGVEVFRSLERLSLRFDRPTEDIGVMVFYITSHQILRELFSMRSRIFDLPIILIPPDTKKNTILEGHKFHPRFIADIESDFEHLSGVLGKLIERHNMYQITIKDIASNKLSNSFH